MKVWQMSDEDFTDCNIAALTISNSTVTINRVDSSLPVFLTFDEIVTLAAIITEARERGIRSAADKMACRLICDAKAFRSNEKEVKTGWEGTD